MCFSVDATSHAQAESRCRVLGKGHGRKASIGGSRRCKKPVQTGHCGVGTSWLPHRPPQRGDALSPACSDRRQPPPPQMSSDDQASVSEKDAAAGSRTGSGSTADSGGKKKQKNSAAAVGSGGSRRIKREWEIVEGLRNGQRFDAKPAKFDGYLSKRRNPPLKGWHKRYFVLDEGTLTYSKTPYNLQKGKVHGVIDVGVSVLTINVKSRKIDLDNGEFVCHLKAKSKEWFGEWVQHLRCHRLYRQNELTYGTRAAPHMLELMTADGPPMLSLDGDSSWTAGAAPVAATGKDGGSMLIGGSRSAAAASAAQAHTVAADSSAALAAAVPAIVTTMASCAGRALASTVTVAAASADEKRRHYGLLRDGSLLRSSSLLSSQNKVIAWLIDSSGGEQYGRDLGAAEQTLEELYVLMRQLTGQAGASDGSCSVASEDAQKKGGGLRRKLSFKSGNKTLRGKSPSRDLGPSASGCSLSPRLGRAAMSAKDLSSDAYLSDSVGCGLADVHQATADPRSDFGSCAEVFLSKSKEVLDTLKNLARWLNTERERLKTLVDKEPTTLSLDLAASGGSGSGLDDIGELKQRLAVLARQNAELRSRLGSDHADAAGDARAAASHQSPHEAAKTRQPSLLLQDLSSRGDLAKTGSLESHTSASDYYDAVDYGDGDVTSDASEESETSTSSTELDERDAADVAASDEVDGAVLSLAQREALAAKCHTGRRSKLPSPKSGGGEIGLVQLLTRNIGKDLTRVSMPVTLNEPLSLLQLLCEELEYSELLEKAASLRDPCERMVYVAAFAASAYAASVKRAGQKPFNPILGETYECLRDDLGWKFVAEQVSHHPPISACHAESQSFIFWQDVRIKTKFWGKSMEFHPSGTVNLVLKKHNEHYQWNKVTTCLHNIFSGQRWVDRYGDVLIKNIGQGVTCKLTFVKASYWSDKRHEVNGMVCGSDGSVVSYLHGRWTEGLYTGTEASSRCIWRPGSFPEDYELYYGFTRFAMELNELLPSEAPKQPRTDSRFRPDQRLLEEGRIADAENEKLRVEKMQRDAAKRRDEQGIAYQPRWFRRATVDGQEHYEYTGEYWKQRESPGFSRLATEPLW